MTAWITNRLPTAADADLHGQVRWGPHHPGLLTHTEKNRTKTMSSLSSQYFNAVLKIMAKKGAIKEYTTKEYINAKVSKYPMILEDFHIEFNDGTVVRAYKISSTATANNTYETLTERPDSKFIEYHTYKEVAYVVQYIQALAKRETSVENPPKNCTHITQEEASELGRLLRGVRTGVKNEP